MVLSWFKAEMFENHWSNQSKLIFCIKINSNKFICVKLFANLEIDRQVGARASKQPQNSTPMGGEDGALPLMVLGDGGTQEVE